MLQKTMPIYEYTCAKCGKTIEVIQKMSDKPLKTHNACGGKLTKLISPAGFQFKGTGWYVTDYARKGQTESPDSPKETKPGEAKADTKTETKSESKHDVKTDKPAKTASPEKKKRS